MHEVYAMIDENSVIQTIMICDNYEEANNLARAIYGDKAYAVECSRWSCSTGCKYIDGVFYEADGVTRCKYIPTDRELAESAIHIANATQDALLEMFSKCAALFTFTISDKIVELYATYLYEGDITVVPNIGNLREMVLKFCGDE